MLTDKQEMVLKFIVGYHADNGYSPSLQDIATHFQWTRGGARSHVDALVRKERVKRYPGRSRSMVPVEDV